MCGYLLIRVATRCSCDLCLTPAAYPDNDYDKMPDRQALPEPSKGPEPVDTNTYDVDPVVAPKPPPPPPPPRSCAIL